MSTVITQKPKLCQCGCGEPTLIAKKTRSSIGHIKGEPIAYINGHNRRKSVRYVIEARGYRTPCWIWQLGLSVWGYATENSKSVYKVMYEEAHGPVPKGLQLDHLCRQKDCINPEHLEPVTCAVNVQRGRLAKLTPYSVMQIIWLSKTTSLTRIEIADIFGVSPGTVFAIKRGRIWSNVTGIARP